MAQAIVWQLPPPGPSKRVVYAGAAARGAGRGGSSRSARAQACARCSGGTRPRTANSRRRRTRLEAARANLARLVWSDHRKVVSLVTDSPFRPVARSRAFEDVIVQVEDAIADGGSARATGCRPSASSRASWASAAARCARRCGCSRRSGCSPPAAGRGADAGSTVTAGDRTGSPGCCASTRSLLKVPLSDLVDLRVAIETMTARAAAERRAGEGSPSWPPPWRTCTTATVPAGRHRVPRRARQGVRQRARAAADGGAARGDRPTNARRVPAVEDWDATRARILADHAAIAERVADGDADAASRTRREAYPGVLRAAARPAD